MPPARYGQLLQETLVKDYVPRLSRLGIDARASWGGPPAPGALGSGSKGR